MSSTAPSPGDRAHELITTWIAQMERGRKAITKLGASVDTFYLTQNFLVSQGFPILEGYTDARARKMKIIAAWNMLEDIFFRCQTNALAINPTADGKDLDVYGTQKDREAVSGIGWIYPAIGLVIVVGAVIATTLRLIASADAEERDSQERWAKLAKDMANAPPDKRAAFAKFLDSSPVKKSRGLWTEIKEGAREGVSVAVVVLALLAFFSLAKTSTTQRKPEKNPCPIRYRRNPFRMSKDPAKQARQMAYLDIYYRGTPEQREALKRRRKGEQLDLLPAHEIVDIVPSDDSAESMEY
jgi:hypothetical protein